MMKSELKYLETEIVHLKESHSYYFFQYENEKNKKSKSRSLQNSNYDIPSLPLTPWNTPLIEKKVASHLLNPK